jgi:hypothetical protein
MKKENKPVWDENNSYTVVKTEILEPELRAKLIAQTGQPYLFVAESNLNSIDPKSFLSDCIKIVTYQGCKNQS